MSRYFIITLLLVCLSFTETMAQNENPSRYLEVRGYIDHDLKPLSLATVNLYDGTNKIKTVETKSDGGFAFQLEMNRQYTIEINKEGFVGKSILFDTQIPDDEKAKWITEFSMGLIKPCGNVDYSTLKQPVDKISFDKGSRDFVSDRTYSGTMRSKIESVMDQTDKCIKEGRKSEDQYTQIVTKAGVAFTRKDYASARQYYQQALQLKPGESLPAGRIKEIDAIEAAKAAEVAAKAEEAARKAEEAQKQKQAENAYSSAMSQGSAAFTSKDYGKAKESYQQALTFRPGDANAKQKLSEAESMIQKEQEKVASEQQLKEKYQQTISAADGLFDQKNYTAAKESYTKALNLMPGEQYPRQRLDAIAKAVDEENKAVADKNALDKAYNMAISNADKLYDLKDYANSKNEYTRAAGLKPQESYPRTKINEVDNLIAAKEKEAADAKSKTDNYTRSMNDGNAAFTNKDYAKAKEYYTEALKNLSGDKLAGEQIKKADYMVALQTARDNAPKPKPVVKQEEKPVVKREEKPVPGQMVFKSESEKQAYLKDLLNKYPAGITLEKYKESNREIYRYIVIRDNEASEYRSVMYTTFPNEQFWVNGKAITRQYFASQVKVRDGESFKEMDMQ